MSCCLQNLGGTFTNPIRDKDGSLKFFSDRPVCATVPDHKELHRCIQKNNEKIRPTVHIDHRMSALAKYFHLGSVYSPNILWVAKEHQAEKIHAALLKVNCHLVLNSRHDAPCNVTTISPETGTEVD